LVIDDDDEYVGKYNQYAQVKDTSSAPNSFSQELVDGDRTDDL